MPAKNTDVFLNVDIAMLKQRIIYNGTDPEFIGLARPGTSESEKGWQLKKIGAPAQPDSIDFAQNDEGSEDNGFIFSWVATKQVTNLTIKNALLSGNTISVTVDGNVVSQAFTNTSDETLSAFATKIAAEAGVDTAVVFSAGGVGNDDRVIQATAAVAGTGVAYTTPSITGGVVQADQALVIEDQITNQGAANTLTYG